MFEDFRDLQRFFTSLQDFLRIQRFFEIFHNTFLLSEICGILDFRRSFSISNFLLRVVRFSGFKEFKDCTFL